ncbi:MAG: hypothetical protein ABFS35_15515 [Bacteroidota bacterium]
MDIDQLFSIIEEKESYTEETISEVKKLIENFPYFQTGHMLLLKAMHTAKSEKFKDQLNISGSFIPDKIRLFKFINAEPGVEEETKEDVKKRVRRDRASRRERTGGTERTSRTDAPPEIRTERKIAEVKPEVKKEDLQADKEKSIKEIKVETKKTAPELKKEPEIKKEVKPEITRTTVESKRETETKKDVELEINRIKKEPQVKIQETKKPETKLRAEEIKKPETKLRAEEIKKTKTTLSNEDVGITVNANSKKRHKKIVQDFFVDPNKDVIIIDETTDPDKMPRKKEPAIVEEPDIDKKEPVFEQKVKRTERKEQPVLKKDEVSKEKKPLVKDKITHVERKEIVKERKTEPIKKERRKVEEKPLVKDKITRIERKETVKEQRTVPIKEERKIVEEKKVVEERKPFERRKSLSDDSKVPVAKKGKGSERKQSDVMNDIFSKIRAIKKEMNISSEENPETIDINTNISKRKRNRIVEPEGVVKGKEKIPEVKVEQKEIAKEESPINIVEEKELAEGKIEEKQVDKKEGKTLTAKDLFNQHQKKREEKKEDKTDEPIKSKIESLFDKQESTEKRIEVDQEKVEEVKVEEPKEIVKKEEVKAPVEKEKLKEEIEPKLEKGSAADALLKRIASKKQKIKEESIIEKEEKEKVEDAPPVKEETINKLEEIIEESIEPTVIKEEEVETQIEKTEEKVSKFVKSKDLIGDFINKSGSLERMTDKETTLKGDMSEKSSDEKEEFMTEAMADLFVQQKYYDKALNVYRKLILKLPQKKTYFAIQIKKVESLIKNNK